jgi:hypothetical protein
MTASTREDGYMEQVDKAGQRARAEALAKIGNVARQTSFLSTLRSADEEWVRFFTRNLFLLIVSHLA